ncbi:hypothetical protein [Paenibacillus antibioticophila]|uniref:hypothetical protein n=1 Tax=Paenibacillus antibioticophila TaxID=1274374 RepID=UPI001BB401E5|nr:hypothetical protein [Paenibacillus antibioticophila]
MTKMSVSDQNSLKRLANNPKCPLEERLVCVLIPSAGELAALRVSGMVMTQDQIIHVPAHGLVIEITGSLGYAVLEKETKL